ncbi:beta-propeller fold lactonase family protein [Paraburkholderia sp. CNPSo 3272]|uniref:YVTN family beta-propeller repeat protein n=1 Tax=Paraburkholderia sp. CNPSo 3272 TaxID=2940931 RepID=UPI0020B8D743|nr:beta-propeller fold lactonase family protein [Paraburkholderia sp. CNPSo 3272]MCP3725210.1 beta-propeller fold lactonase family protein [Paraburkholderia sp. CNPSo 3272]
MKLSRRTLLGHGLALPLSFGLSPLLALRSARASAAPASLAIVMNSGEASVSVIDMTSREVIRTLPTMREPSHWALSPDRNRLYIADASGNALFIVDPRNGTSLGHKVIADPYQLGFTPDHRYLVINALRINYVDVYRADDLTLVKRFSPGEMPSHLDFSPDSRWSFNSMQESSTLVSFDLTNMTIRWKAKLGSTPAGVLWHNGKVLVCVMGADHVAEVDPVTGNVLRRIKTGIGPHNLFLTPDRQTLYVTNRVGGSLAALDATTLELRRTYPLHAGGPDDLSVAPDGKVWVTLRFREQVAVLDPVSGHYDTIDVGRSPHGIFLTPQLNHPGYVSAELL